MSDPSLVFSRPSNGNDDEEPGLHAFLVAVSNYPNLQHGENEVAETYGLGQLTSPARTVRDLATLLIAQGTKLNPPLKTLRVLASPSGLELKCESEEMKDGVASLSLCDAQGATLANVQAAAQRWREDASYNRDDATLFYFAGHGIQLSRGDSILLLEDFLGGGPLLSRAVNFGNIYNGMAHPSIRNVAQTQIYVVDACRASIEAFKKYDGLEAAPVFDIELGGADDRIAPIFMAAGAGNAAYGTDGGRSYFGDDFIKCLSGGAAECLYERGEAVWALTIGELVRVLSDLVEAHNKDFSRKRRTFQFDKFTASLRTKLRTYDGAPQVDCKFLVEPEGTIAGTIVDVKDKSGKSVMSFPTSRPLAPHPYPFRIEAGRYLAIATQILDECARGMPQHVRELREFIEIKPPNYQFVFQMTERVR